MAPPAMDVRMIKDILRLKLQQGLSHEAIARSLKISKGVVSKYVLAARQAGLTEPMLQTLEEAPLLALLHGGQAPQAVMPADFAWVHRELKRKGVTLMVLWQEYRAQHEGHRTWAYSQFCEHYRRYTKTLRRSMRQVHRAGEKLFVDYAGPTLALDNGGRGQVFVATLGASSYTFACVTADQSMRAWLGSIERAFRFVGGVPQLVVPDNARALIAQPDRYEPQIQTTVLDFARHYGVSFLPARPYSPQDKGKVESAVQVVERWILARLRHVRLADLGQANEAVGALLQDLNARAFQKQPGSRAELWHTLDKPALQALPGQSWVWGQWRTLSVHIDYHVEVDRHRYSVPHALVGQKLQARITDSSIELMHRGQRVAIHRRVSRPGGYSTIEEHMPAAHRAQQAWTPQRLVRWGEQIGPRTAEAVSAILNRLKHPEQGYRSCLGLLSLQRRYGDQRLEAACMMALQMQAVSYRNVREILQRGRDRAESSPAPGWISPEHENLRGSQYYH